MRPTLVLAIALVATACTGGSASEPPGTLIGSESFDAGYPPAPDVPTGDLDPRAEAELAGLLVGVTAGTFENEAVDQVVAAGDARVAWALADLMRFIQVGEPAAVLERGFSQLTGASLAGAPGPAFTEAVDHLIAWDLPAWPLYASFKRDLYTVIEPGWDRFFEEDVSIDWRLVTWGGVLIDDRPLGSPDPCPRGCIPALDDPLTTPANDGDWYSDEAIVFGLEVNGETLALPKNQMQIHEMMNLTLGGVRLGIPYCTLCGSAQAYVTEGVPDGFEPAVLRTSGLLSRSNKVMYDLLTGSVFDTFTGRALSGPLGEVDLVLDQVSVVSSTWGQWKQDHPDTRIIARDGGIGRSYSDDPLRGRDDEGPIFPTGPVDPRLPVMELVVGAVDAEGNPIAFPVESTRAALEAGTVININGLSVSLSGDGLIVTGPEGDVGSHESFWFAWSQFNPETLIWSPIP